MVPVLTRSQRRLSDEAPPPDPPDVDGHGGGDWTLLTVAANQVVAYLIRGRLAEEGIDVVLDASNASPGAWLYPFGDPGSPVRVFVRLVQLTEASLLLHEVEQVPQPASAPVATPRRSSWIGFRLIVALAAMLALSGLLVLGPCISHWFCV